MKKKIVVVGSINMDLVVSTPRVPVMGETVLGSGFAIVPGGKGANQAVAVARLGGDVHMVGCTGNDVFGNALIQNLSSDNIKVENIKVIDGCATGVAMIVVKDGDNFIVVDPGANAKLTPKMIEALENEIKDSFIVIIQLEIPLETVEKAVEIAKKHSVKVLLNPAPAAHLSDQLLAKVDIFTPNESECEIITGIAINNIEDAKSAVEWLRKKGVSQVLVTLGENGVLYNRGGTIVHKPVPDVEVVDTTAAGDSFSGALAVALSEGKDIDSSVDFANIVGTLSVMKKGAQTSIPYRCEVEAFEKK